MPTYEYFCPACGLSFEKMVPMDERDSVACPKCENDRVKRMLSTFAVKGPTTGTAKPADPCSTCSSGGEFG